MPIGDELKPKTCIESKKTTPISNKIRRRLHTHKYIDILRQ